MSNDSYYWWDWWEEKLDDQKPPEEFEPLSCFIFFLGSLSIVSGKLCFVSVSSQYIENQIANKVEVDIFLKELVSQQFKIKIIQLYKVITV